MRTLFRVHARVRVAARSTCSVVPYRPAGAARTPSSLAFIGTSGPRYLDLTGTRNLTFQVSMRRCTSMDHHISGSLSEDLGGSLSDDRIPRELMKSSDVLGSAARLKTSDNDRANPISSKLPRTPSTLMTPVNEDAMVCPYQSRRRRLRRSCRENGLEVIRPLGRGSFGRIVLARRELDGAYFALKLQRLTGSELTPEQVSAAEDHHASVQSVVEGLPAGIVKTHLETALLELGSKIKNAAPKEGEFRLFDGKQLRRSMAESIILDHLQAESEDSAEGATFVVRKHRTFEDREWMFIVLDYIEGGTLEDQLARCGGTMSEDVARFYLCEILMGLKYLRSRNVSHRDIKPANVMINAQGHCVLMDFGLSTRIEKGLQTFCGTAEYISPEVLTQKTWNAASLDTWSFGVLAHKLLTGVTPFEADSVKGVFMKIIMTNSLEPHAKLSPEAHSLISSILTGNPEDRPSIPEIMSHEWFAGVDWAAVCQHEVTPPWLPGVAGISDLESGVIHL